MTAHLVLRYAPLGVRRRDRARCRRGGRVERAARSSASARRCASLLAALIVHSANDAADRARARDHAAAGGAGSGRQRPRVRSTGRCRGDPVARFVLLMNAEARRLGLRDTVYRTPHGLDEPGAHSSAHDVLDARATGHGLARLPRPRAPADASTIPGHAMLQTSNTLLAAYAGLDGVKTGHTDEAGWNLAASAERDGVRLYAILLGAPDEARPRPTTSHACSTGASTASAAPPCCAPARSSAARARCRVVAAKGLSARLDPGEQVRERVVLPRRLNSPVRAGQQARLRRAAQRAAACSGAYRSSPTGRAAAARRSCPGCAHSPSAA